ncbi:MAG: class I SAM-dependent methyltransferase [Planctomycetota bacterium]
MPHRSNDPETRFGPVSPDRPAEKLLLPRHALSFFPGPTCPERHPTRWAFPAWLRNESVPWLRTLAELYDHPAAFPASISPEAGLLLFSLVRNIRPRTVVEVGSFIGVSAIWIAAALEDIGDDPAASGDDAAARPGRLHTIDNFEDLPESGYRTAAAGDRQALVERHLRHARLDHRVTIHAGTSWDVLEAESETFRDAGGVHLALLDGDHSAEGLRKDVIAVERSLPTGGYLIVHDTIPERCGGHVGGRHLLEHINSFAAGLYEQVELYLAPLNYGLGIFRRMG